MILPTKRLSENRSMLALGAEVLRLLDEPKTVSRLLDDLKRFRVDRGETQIITYNWFILVLDLLYTLKTIELERGRIRKVE